MFVAVVQREVFIWRAGVQIWIKGLILEVTTATCIIFIIDAYGVERNVDFCLPFIEHDLFFTLNFRCVVDRSDINFEVEGFRIPVRRPICWRGNL